MQEYTNGDYVPWLATGGAGLLGRLMFHAKLVQSGRRKPFSWVLFWDIPIALGEYRDWETDRKSTRLNSSHSGESRMPSSA